MQYSVYHIGTDGESCNALFLLARPRTVVVMTTVISSHVKDKIVSSLDTTFSSL